MHDMNVATVWYLKRCETKKVDDRRASVLRSAVQFAEELGKYSGLAVVSWIDVSVGQKLLGS